MPLAEKFAHGAMVPANAKSHLPSSISFQDKQGVPKLNEDVKILCSNPRKALPCMNMRLLVYRMSKSVLRPQL